MAKRQPTDPDSPTVTVPEAARLLGISVSKAYDAVRSGEIPSLQIGTRRIVSRQKLMALINGTEQPQPFLRRLA